ncbi:hypothetical protein BC938DRAFT_474888 [Jimgerdemannia flammicorona]|uniref:Ankyrin repeat-containing domain protein n=1 Tax=Jimgerdemannia flammicorona TaxID=994334 RepID=A0A433Q1G6_9FUNG|nr:hypothetical protein BC938DRAFT_474888 [Jimgerdemannia flammicorona]
MLIANPQLFENSDTPFHLVADSETSDAVKALLQLPMNGYQLQEGDTEEGVDVNIADNVRQTPLYWAAECHPFLTAYTMMSRLIAFGARTVKDIRDDTALGVALHQHGSVAFEMSNP